MLTFLLIILSFMPTSQPDNIREDVQNYLKQNLAKYDHFEFEILQMPPKAAKIIINNDKVFTFSGGYANLNVTAIDRNNNVTQSYITIKIKVYANILAAAEDIKSREEITPEKVEKKILDITMLKGNPVTKPEELEGYASKFRIAKGRIITSDIIETIPVIKSGDRINANSIRGNVIVTTDAIAQQDGRVGDVIRVILKNNKQFKGKVLDSNNVIIIE